MKIRNGFVSNSSSSSFCIYGIDMDFSDVIEKLKASNFLTTEEVERMEEEDEWYEVDEIIESKTVLSVHRDDDNCWIGRSWSSVGDDETGSQFKESVKDELEKILGSDVDDCSTYEETIYN